MNVKIFGLVFSMIFLALSAASAASPAQYSASVGVQSIARAVVDKKLVNTSARNAIRMALETERANLEPMVCRRSAGKDYCSFGLFIKDDPATVEAEETSLRLDVILHQGTVRSAKLHLIAG